MQKDVLLKVAKVKQERLRRQSGNHFWSFCLYYDYKFFSKRLFLKEIADAFQRVHDAYAAGLTYNVAVSLPPRSGKSYISSLFIAWMIGKFPSESVMRNCCSDTLYQKLSYDTRDIIRSTKFRTVFQSVRLKADKQNVDGWNVETAKQVTYFGGGVGGTVIGFGASMLAMTDDLYKNLEQARSDTVNEKTWSWKQGTHDSRVERNACNIDIGTRWSKSDVLGRLEESGVYDEIIRVPALTEAGKSFCEDVKTTTQYLEMQKKLDPEIWAAEYMQRPIELEGLLFPRSELQMYDPENTSFTSDNYSIVVADPADTGDDFAAFLGYVRDGYLYVDRFICNNSGVEVNVPGVTDLIIKNKPVHARIEGNGGWVQTAKDIRAKVWEGADDVQIQIYKSQTNKEERILSQAYYIKNRILFRSDYQNIPDYNKAIDIITSYMRNKKNQKDDPVDVLTEGVSYLRRTGLLE